MAHEMDLADAAAEAENLPDPEEVVGDDGDVPLEDLFDESFMRQYTEFESFDEMVAASPSDADSAEELGLVPDGTWDEFAAETTAFEDEEAMVFAVRDDYVTRQLGL